MLASTFALTNATCAAYVSVRIRLSQGAWSDPEVLDQESLSSRLLVGGGNDHAGDAEDGKTKIAFFFEYGIVVFWAGA